MAEWLRRLTRNQMGSSRVGSNPTRSGEFFKTTRYSTTKNFVENDHDGIRTHNLLIRSQTPYPLGHATSAISCENKRYTRAAFHDNAEHDQITKRMS